MGKSFKGGKSAREVFLQLKRRSIEERKWIRTKVKNNHYPFRYGAKSSRRRKGRSVRTKHEAARARREEFEGGKKEGNLDD